MIVAFKWWKSHCLKMCIVAVSVWVCVFVNLVIIFHSRSAYIFNWISDTYRSIDRWDNNNNLNNNLYTPSIYILWTRTCVDFTPFHTHSLSSTPNFSMSVCMCEFIMMCIHHIKFIVLLFIQGNMNGPFRY